MQFVEVLKTTELGKILITFFVAMLPIIELRGAIPLGVSMGLPHITSMIVSVIGNLVPVPFIFLFIRRIFNWMRKKNGKLGSFVDRMERKAYSKRDLVRRFQALGLLLLVAIPLPGTGAWTGALVAVILGIRLKLSLPAIVIGVLIAAVLVTGITFGFTEIFC